MAASRQHEPSVIDSSLHWWPFFLCLNAIMRCGKCESFVHSFFFNSLSVSHYFERLCVIVLTLNSVRQSKTGLARAPRACMCTFQCTYSTIRLRAFTIYTTTANHYLYLSVCLCDRLWDEAVSSFCPWACVPLLLFPPPPLFIFLVQYLELCLACDFLSPSVFILSFCFFFSFRKKRSKKCIW